MKALKIIGIIVVVLVLLVAGAAVYLNHYVQTPEFKDFVLKAAHDALGSSVAIDDMKVSLLSGVTLKGVRVANPPGFSGQLLEARAFVLRYRLGPLLHKRVEIQELSLDGPTITLVRNDKSEWNYEKLSAKSTNTPAVKPTGGNGAPSTQGSGMNVTLSKITLSDGEVAMLTGADSKELLRVQKINLSSGVTLSDGKLTGNGKASIGTINAANSLFLRQIAAPVAITPNDLKLAPLTGKLADGDVSGEITVKTTGEFRYVVQLQVSDADVAKLLQEAGKKAVMSGKLKANASLDGTGGLPTLAGQGRAEIANGQLMEIPLLKLLATVLQVPELRELKFTECLLEFSITNNVMQTPVIRLASPQIQIAGKGAVSLDNYSLNHDLTFTFAKGLLDRAPKEVRELFTEGKDGSLALDIHVSGPYDAPKTDLTEHIAKAVGQQLIEKGLQKIFK